MTDTTVLRRRKGKLIRVDKQILRWRKGRKSKGVCAAQPARPKTLEDVFSDTSESALETVGDLHKIFNPFE